MAILEESAQTPVPADTDSASPGHAAASVQATTPARDQMLAGIVNKTGCSHTEAVALVDFLASIGLKESGAHYHLKDHEIAAFHSLLERVLPARLSVEPDSAHDLLSRLLIPANASGQRQFVFAKTSVRPLAHGVVVLWVL